MSTPYHTLQRKRITASLVCILLFHLLVSTGSMFFTDYIRHYYRRKDEKSPIYLLYESEGSRSLPFPLVTSTLLVTQHVLWSKSELLNDIMSYFTKPFQLLIFPL